MANSCGISFSRNFDSGTLSRGAAYYRAGSARLTRETDTSDGPVVEGEVDGSARRPYKVRAVLISDAAAVRLQRGECSCPMVRNCKHVVALSYEWAAVSAAGPRNPGLRAAVAKGRRTAASLPVSATGFVLNADFSRKTPLSLEVFRCGYGSEFRRLTEEEIRLIASRPPLDGDGDIFDRLAAETLNEGILAVETSAHAHLLHDVIATGRCRWRDTGGYVSKEHLAWGAERSLSLIWRLEMSGLQVPELRLGVHGDGAAVVGDYAFYLDRRNGLVGQVDPEQGIADLTLMVRAAPLGAHEAGAAIRAYRNAGSTLLPPLDPAGFPTVGGCPAPVLKLSRPEGGDPLFGKPDISLGFEYGDFLVPSWIEGDRLHMAAPCGPSVIVRNFPEEAVYAERLRMCSEGRNYIEFLRESVNTLRGEGWKIGTDGYREPEFIDAEAWDAEFATNNDVTGIPWFDFSVHATIDGIPVEMSDILRQAISQSGAGADGFIYLQLANGRIMAVAEARIRPLLDALALLCSGADEGAARRIEIAAELNAAALAVGARIRGSSGLIRLALAFASGDFPAIEPPADFTGMLRGYQSTGAAWLGLLSEHALGGLLAFDMGLGKTTTTLFHLCSEKRAGRLHDCAFIVAPLSVVDVWRSDMAKFTPSMRAVYWTEGNMPRIRRGTDIVVTTYDMLRRHIDEIETRRWSVAVLDEAQVIRNPSSKVSLAAARIVARQRVALSGTPVENRLTDLWSIFRYLEPSVLGTNKAFRLEFAKPIETGENPSCAGVLAKRIMPFVMRRTKEEVARELPAKVDTVELVDLGPEQARLYETVRAAMQANVQLALAEKGLNGGRIIVLNALTRLRQVCLDHRLVQMPHSVIEEQSSKMTWLIDMVRHSARTGKRMLIFSQFTSMLDLITPELDACGISHITLTGKSRGRAKLVETFQAGAVQVFLISLKAGGSGITLTRADTVVHFDPWWNPAVTDQATDRAHRIGQTKTVSVHRLIARNTIEEAILELQEKKRSVAAAVFSEDADALSAMTENEIRMLFSVSPVRDGFHARDAGKRPRQSATA